MPTSQIIPTAEPFFFPASKTGCLLVHGFTGALKEMRWMGEYLAEKGFGVLGVRLAGHATKPEDMVRSNWTDWTASVEEEFNLLCGTVDRIHIIGLSMGAVLSLLMSTRLDVKSVTAMSTPYKLVDDWRLNYIGLLSKFIPYLPKGNSLPGAGWFDQEAWQDHVSYSENPVRSLGQLNRLLSEMRKALPKVRVPVLLMHSKDDGYVLPENLEKVYATLGTSDKTKLYITGSGHVVTRDAARYQVFEAVCQFVRRVESESK